MTTRREEFINGMSFTLESLEVIWCKLVTPDEFEGKKRWKLTAILPDALADSMEKAGMNVKVTKEDVPRRCIDSYRNCVTRKGKTLSMIKVMDESGAEIDGAIVGNGSVCDLNVSARYCTVGGKEHCPLRLDSVIVKKLVPYNVKGGESPFK